MTLNLHDERYDDMFYQIVTQIGKGPQGLIGACLGFLKRRTDFFYQAEPGDKMGFPPGYSQQMIYQLFKAFQKQHFDKFPHKKGLEERWDKYQKELQKKRQHNSASEKNGKSEGQDEKNQQEKNTEPKQEPNEESKSSQEQQSEKRTLPSPSIDPKPLRPQSKKKDHNDAKQQNSAATPVDSEISTYNGDKTEKYNWSQTHKELTVQIPIPEGTSSKEIDVKYTNTKVCIKSKKTGQVILQGKFDDRINVQDSLWYIQDNKWIVLNLQKSNEVIWKTIIRGDKEIDPKKVDNSKKLQEFDVETQGHLNKVLYEQNRRFNGLPTTQQQKSIQKFEQIYKSQNSPFKGKANLKYLTYNLIIGQPYNPSHISMQGRPVKAPFAH